MKAPTTTEIPDARIASYLPDITHTPQLSKVMVSYQSIPHGTNSGVMTSTLVLLIRNGFLGYRIEF